MAAAIYVHQGDSIDYTPTADISAGDVVVQSELVGVAKLDIKADRLGALAVVGVFDFPKEAGGGVIFGVGDLVYWDDTNDVATAGGGADKLIGKAVAPAADGDTTVRVRMSQ